MQLIEIKDLSVSYDDVQVLRGVNLNIDQSDFIGIIGPNGGGKTTLIKAILGIIKPSGGTIKKSSNELKIGYLPQRHTLDVNFPVTAIEVALSGLQQGKKWWQKITKLEREHAMQLMRQTGIEQLANRQISALSGGEMQRLLLCRSLMCNPELLILDEPTTYVDSTFESNFYQIIRHLSSQMAIVMVSHDLGTICSYVRSIACVNGTLHFHPQNVITEQHLDLYECPIKLVTHGEVAHTVLKKHN